MAIIWIDAGHGGRDAGAQAGGVREKAVTLAYSLVLQAELQWRGHDVRMTRAADVDLAPDYPDFRVGKGVDMRRRCEQANASKAACFVSIHANAGANVLSNGAWVLYMKGSTRGQRLAARIFGEIAKIAGIADADPEQEIYSDDTGWTGGRTLMVLRKTAMPAALVELGFLTNAGDRAQLQDVTTRCAMSVAIANGIEAWLKT